MLINNRVIWEDDATLVDISKKLNDVFANNQTFNFVTTDDYLYLGSDMPFNHRYFDVTTANIVASVPSVSIWDGNAWNAAVDVIDETQATSGTSLGQSGIIRWVLNKDYFWQRADSTEDIAALSTLKIYDLYWARISWSATLTNTTALNYIGHSFADDSQLGGYYPDLVRSEIIGAYSSGQTNWKKQHVLAAEEIIADLRRKKKVVSRNQIMNPEIFNEAAIHKVAELIMRGLGKDWAEDRANALKDYSVALNSMPLELDTDGNGRLDLEERAHYSGLVRG